MTAVAIATFDDEGPFLRARTRVVAADYRVLGEWHPYAPEGSGPGERGILPAAIGGGVLAGGGLFTLTTWSTVLAYPFNSGGRALWSWPAFIPAPVEFAALGAAIAGVIALFRNAQLTRLHHAAFDFREVERASLDAFVLAVGCDEGDSANHALALFAAAGATHSRVVAPR